MGEAERRAYLEQGGWYTRGHDNKPTVMTAAEAWAQQTTDKVFYLVNWWGDLPSGLQEFRFLAKEGNASYPPQFRILMAYGQSEREAYLEADELVLMFMAYPNDVEGTDD
jgi:hypothetical protein